MIALDAMAEPQRGWAGPIAILAAAVAFRLLMPWLTKIANRSPTPPAAGGVRPIAAGRSRFRRVDPSRDTTREPGQTGRDPRRDPTRPADDPGVDTGPRRRDTTFPSVDTTPEPGWFGRRVRLPDGSTVVRSALHIARTGDSPPPEPVRDDFDDALDLVAEPEPDELDEWLEWAAEQDIGYNERVRRGAARFRVSESTVKRRIQSLKDEEDET